MPEPTPADIERARELDDNIAWRPFTVRTQAIAQALAAERERAAVVIENIDDPNCDGGNIYAAAIRNQNTGE